MAYLVQQTVPYSITIDGTDYSNAFVQMGVSDTSAFMTGMVVTTGTITLGTPYTGDSDASAYYRAPRFERGALINLQVQYPDGTVQMHPRGWLYVLQSSYDPNSETTTLDVGCQLALRRLTDEVGPIIRLAPVTLEPAQQTFEGAAGAFVAKGQYLWQDNTGTLQINNVTDVDRSTIESGEWVSVRSVTALSVSPLAGSDNPPDKVEVEYEVPADDPPADDDTDTELGDPIPEDDDETYTPSEDVSGGVQKRTDTNTTTSYYFVSYPGTAFVRVPDNPTQDPEDPVDVQINTAEIQLEETTACGEPPEEPEALPTTEDEDGGATYTQTCEDGYSTIKIPFYVPTYKVSTNVSIYDGPGGQLRRQVQTETAAAFEVNGGYYADKFDFCQRVYRNPCLPSGSCQREGLEQIVASRTELTNFFGKGGQIVRSITDRFIPRLAAGISENYRFGTASNGAPTSFDNTFGDVNKDRMFRATRVEREYYVEDGQNVEKTTTFTTAVSRGGGVGRGGNRGGIDALDGIITTQISRSSSNATLALAPPTAGAAQVSKKKKKNVAVNPGLQVPPIFANPATDTAPLTTGKFAYIEKIAPPVPYVGSTDDEAKANADYYAYVYMRSKWGDANGLAIVEYQRKDMDDNWYPTRPFVYYDDLHEYIMIMRMDAVTWAVNPDSAAVNISSNYICDATGSINIPHNLMGDALPNLSGGAPTPPALVGDGSTGDPEYPTASVQPTGVTMVYEIDVELTFNVDVTTYCRGGVCPVAPTESDLDVRRSFVAFVSGNITAPGNLLTPDANGGMPITSMNTLIIDENEIIVGDIFA